MDSVSINLLSQSMNYEEDIKTLINNNQIEYSKLQDNLNLITDIIKELLEKSEKISLDINKKLDIHTETINIFFEINKKCY